MVTKPDKFRMEGTSLKFIIELNTGHHIITDLLRETRDNIVASVVDLASIFFAYRLGVAQLGPWAGLAYGAFDAWIVIWQRERISDYVHRAANVFRRTGWLKRNDSLPWIAD